MTLAFAREDPSVVGRWWWTVDRWSLAAVTVLILFGSLLILAASPPVAERLGLEPFYFARRQILMLIPAVALMLATSTLAPRDIRRLAVFGFVVGVLLLALVPSFGVEIKGARRWIHFAGLSVQPSEFVKPTFAVVAAWLFSLQRTQPRVPGNLLAFLIFAVVAALLVLQPDIGMVVVVTATWLSMFFVAGLAWRWVVLATVIATVALVTGYMTLPHMQSRIDRFLDPASGDRFQVSTSLEAFANGGMMGRGPGEGRVKEVLPDAHADFIFAVAGEEFGMLPCLIIVALFGALVLRGFTRLLGEANLFVVFAVTGLLTQFGLQAVINMGSTLDLIPTKGMTLPFVSYGGSSLIALAVGMGMVLALTRRRAGMGGA